MLDSYGKFAPIPIEDRPPKYICNCGNEYTHKKSLDRHIKTNCG